RPLILLGSLCALTFCIEAGLEGWSAIHLEDTLGASPAIGGLGPGLFMAAMVLGRVAGQSFGDRFREGHLLVASGLVAAIGIELAAAAPGPWVALGGFGLAGLAVSAAAPTILSLTGRSSTPENRGTSMAAVTSIAYLGFFLSPAVVGGIADIAGLRVGLAALGGVGILLAVLAPRIGRLEVGAVGETVAAGASSSPLIEG
ncbi:MAG: MFS transporter, partial [Actinomycetota bacterium]|nr:MFS transporter [Actinomycetota bacterium]